MKINRVKCDVIVFCPKTMKAFHASIHDNDRGYPDRTAFGYGAEAQAVRSARHVEECAHAHCQEPCPEVWGVAEEEERFIIYDDTTGPAGSIAVVPVSLTRPSEEAIARCPHCAV